MGWKNPRWNSLTGPDADTLRSVFRSLEEFFEHPTFPSGFEVGNAGLPTVNAAGVKVPAPLVGVDSDTPGVAWDGKVTRPMIDPNAVGANELDVIALAVDKYIRSDNFSPGTAGWAIDGNGNAEFNDAVFRGEVEASTITGGSFRTSATGRRIVISDDSVDRIQFFSNHVLETSPGHVSADPTGVLFVTSPVINGKLSYIGMGDGVGVSGDYLTFNGEEVTLAVGAGGINLYGDVAVFGGKLRAENRRTAGFTRAGSVTAASNSAGDITIPHGMGATPMGVSLTLDTDGASASYFVVQVQNVDATNITARLFNLNDAGNAAASVTKTVHWVAVL